MQLDSAHGEFDRRRVVVCIHHLDLDLDHNLEIWPFTNVNLTFVLLQWPWRVQWPWKISAVTLSSSVALNLQWFENFGDLEKTSGDLEYWSTFNSRQQLDLDLDHDLEILLFTTLNFWLLGYVISVTLKSLTTFRSLVATTMALDLDLDDVEGRSNDKVDGNNTSFLPRCVAAEFFAVQTTSRRHRRR